MKEESASRRTHNPAWSNLPAENALLLQKLTTTGVHCMKDYNQLMQMDLPSLSILEDIRGKNRQISSYKSVKFDRALGYRITQRFYAPDEEDDRSRNILNVMKSLQETNFQRPLKAELINGTPFYRNSLNLVFGLSKSGKSESIARVLHDAKLGKNDVIWLDRDYNVNQTTLDYMYSFTYLNFNISEAEEQLLQTDGKGKIIVFDSLKDFSRGEDLDSNAGSQNVMEYIREFTKANYSVIAIAHATKDKDRGIKIKGNEETIKSKSDIVFRLNNNAEFREFEVVSSRLANGSSERFKCYDLNAVKSKADAIISEHEEITVRALTNKLPSSIRDTFTKYQNELIEVVKDGKKRIAKCIQNV